MSQALTNAAKAVIKPASAAYYGKVDEKNPVVIAFEQELNEVYENFKKQSSILDSQNSPKNIFLRGFVELA